MPAPGKQHSFVANPFEEPTRRVSEYTAQEIATLQSRLEKQLGPEYISARTGPSGQKVHYITAEKCIALANEVFGFNGWSSSIQNIQVDFVDENPQTFRVSLGLSVIMRVTLRDGTFHEDIGYGNIENCKGKAAAFEKAKKEGTTDALKRALRSFGNVLGNCIYDKQYLQKVTKMKVEPTKFDQGSLHRHQDFAPIKKEPVEAEKRSEAPPREQSVVLAQLPTEESLEDFLGEFDEADFCTANDEHPDEVILINSAQTNGTSRSSGNMQPPSAMGQSNAMANGSRQPQTPSHFAPRSEPVNAQNNRPNRPGPPANQFNQNQNRQSLPPKANVPNTGNYGNQAGLAAQPSAAGQDGDAPGGDVPGTACFFSARAVKDVPEDVLASDKPVLLPQGDKVFNAHAESPSIRKTPGIDHSKSKAVGRNGQHYVKPVADSAASNSGPGNNHNNTNGPSAAPQQGFNSGPRPGPSAARGNVVNPQFDNARRIGAPGGVGSPLANRGQYRPPTMKRPPLVEKSDNPTHVVAGAGHDNKRQKMA